MSEAPAGSCRGFGDERYKARWVLPRGLGGRHIGLYKGKPLSFAVRLTAALQSSSPSEGRLS